MTTTSGMTRRDLLKRSAATGAGIAAGSGLLNLAMALPASATPPGGYGALVADPRGLLDLPQDFSYKLFAVSGDAATDPATSGKGLVPDRLDTGQPYPAKPDGTGSFFQRSTKQTLLVQNHEITTPERSNGAPVPKTKIDAPVYDPSTTTAMGGTSNVVLDENANVQSRYTSIAGTMNNCAGGVTPWGSWLTCEENESVQNGVRHGYVFEVDAFGRRTTGQPLVAMGRFPHEAVAVDPTTNTAYLTEDAGGPLGLFYRFIPTDKSGTFNSYAAGGQLQAMRVPGIDDLSQITQVGTVLEVIWVDIPDIDAVSTSIRKQFPSPEQPTGTMSNRRVTRSKKFEGAWWGLGTAWINASFAKPKDVANYKGFIEDTSRPATPHDGQVWRYNPRTSRLTLVAYFGLVSEDSNSPLYDDFGTFDGPDNIVVSPFGGAFLCEDGDGIQHITGLDNDGTAYAFGLNKANNSEFTGACFSGEGRFMFVNIQTPGVGYAITGPWARDVTPPVIPEVPAAALLPIGAMALVGGAIALRNHRGVGADPAV